MVIADDRKEYFDNLLNLSDCECTFLSSGKRCDPVEPKAVPASQPSNCYQYQRHRVKPLEKAEIKDFLL